MIPVEFFTKPAFDAGASVDAAGGTAPPVRSGSKMKSSGGTGPASFRDLLTEAGKARATASPAEPPRPGAAERAAQGGSNPPAPADDPVDAAGSAAELDPETELLALLVQVFESGANAAAGACLESPEASDPGRRAAEIMKLMEQAMQAPAGSAPMAWERLVDLLRKAGAADALGAPIGLQAVIQHLVDEPGRGLPAQIDEKLSAFLAELKTAPASVPGAASAASAQPEAPAPGRDVAASLSLPAEGVDDPGIRRPQPNPAEGRLPAAAALEPTSADLRAAVSDKGQSPASPQAAEPAAHHVAPESVKRSLHPPAPIQESQTPPAEIPHEARSRQMSRVSDAPVEAGKEPWVKLKAPEEAPAQGEGKDGSRQPGGEPLSGGRLLSPENAAEGEEGQRFETAARDLRAPTAPEGPVLKPGESLTAGREKEAASAAVRSGVFDQIVQRAAVQLKDNHNEMRIDLKPEHLGQVRLQIVTDNQMVSVRIVTELAAVRDMLETHLSQLKTDLQQQGLQVDRLEVSVAADHRQTPNRQKKSDKHRTPAAVGRTGFDNEGSAEAAAIALYGARPAGRGAIDMFI